MTMPAKANNHTIRFCFDKLFFKFWKCWAVSSTHFHDAIAPYFRLAIDPLRICSAFTMGCDSSKHAHNKPNAEPGPVIITRRSDESGHDAGMFKIVILGDVAVGKTSLLRQFIDGQFEEKYEPTVPASFRKTVVNLGSDYNNREVRLNIWDTAGQERFHQVRICLDV